MPTNLTDSSTLTDPIQGPADADAQNAASYNLGFQGAANRTRWLADRLGGFPSGGGEWSYPAVRTRNFLLTLADGREIRDASGGTPEFYFTTGPSTSVFWSSLVNNGRVLFPLNDCLRDGMVIKDIKIAVLPGAARATQTNRVRLGLYYELPDF